MSNARDLFRRLLRQVAMTDEPLAHPNLEDVPDSVVRDSVRSMLDRGLVEGELHTALGGDWTVYTGLRITRLGRSYLSRHLDDRRRLTERGGSSASTEAIDTPTKGDEGDGPRCSAVRRA